MPMVSVNGAELYHEVRGSGPPVLLIMGATGDGGHFDTLADLLADEFTVITYDRRGNGRSPPPAGWTTTSAEEQADDAAALVDSLAVGPLAVFGTSSGGTSRSGC
jgi:pimeloyl-ACP methyl ester carboxylesterase